MTGITTCLEICLCEGLDSSGSTPDQQLDQPHCKGRNPHRRTSWKL